MTDVNVYLGEARRKRRRRRLSFTLGFLAAFLVLAGGGGAWLLLRSDFFRIASIEISGNRRVQKEEILALVQASIESSGWRRFLGSGNILAWPREVHDANLTLPLLGSVSIEKAYDERKVRLSVKEREPVGIWCLTESQDDAEQNAELRCFWFDDQGVLFEPAPRAEGSLIKVVQDYSGRGLGVGSRVLPEWFIGNFFSLLQVLQEAGMAIEEVRLDDLGLQEIKVSTYGGPALYFSLRFPATAALAVLRSLAAQAPKLEYIDFRVENRAYYR